MRSRYSAYAKGRWAYLSETVAGRAAEGWRVDASAAVKWLGLEVIDVVRGGVDDDYGEVYFLRFTRMPVVVGSRCVSEVCLRRLMGGGFMWTSYWFRAGLAWGLTGRL